MSSRPKDIETAEAEADRAAEFYRSERMDVLLGELPAAPPAPKSPPLVPARGAKRRHTWAGGDRCTVCGLRRQQGGQYGVVLYFPADGSAYRTSAGTCQ